MSHCLFCGGQVGGATCERCGAIHQVKNEKHVGAHCPRCKEPRLAPFAIGPASLQGCATCRGSFLPATEWDLLLDVAERGRLPSEAGSVVPPPPGQGPSQTALTDRINCPTCGQGMQTLEFATFSKVMVDVCRLHGIWLDGGELIAVVEAVRAGRSLEREMPKHSFASAVATDLAIGAANVAGAATAAAASVAANALVDVLGAVIESIAE